MAILILKEPHVEVDGVDLSDHVTEVHVQREAEDVETTAAVAHLQPLGTKRVQGKRSDMFTIVFQQDFDAGSVAAVIDNLFDSGELFTVSVTPYDDVVSATNPEYRGTCILTTDSPIDGAVGDLLTVEVDFPVSGIIDKYVTGLS